MTRIVDIFLGILAVVVHLSTSRTIPKNTDCSFESSNYSLSWTFDELSNDIVFRLVTQSPFDNNFYTSIAFGNGNAPKDVISVFVRSGQIGLMDGHLAEDGAIESDDKTNVQALQFDFEDGKLSAQFARPIATIDSDDVELDNCVTIFFPTTPREMIAGVPLEMGSNLEKVKVCDIAVTCNHKLHAEVFKREEEAVCSNGPQKQKNRVEWRVEGERVVFDIHQNAKKGRWWTAIGVGESMDDLNILMVFAENGRLKKQGIYRTEGKMQPQELTIDGMEYKKEKVLMENGKAHFTMSIEKEFLTSRTNAEGCIPLQISVLGGEYQPNFSIRKHHNTPQSILVCNLNGCGDSTQPEEEHVEETPQTPQPEPEPEHVDETPKTEAEQPQPNENAIEEGSGEPSEPKQEEQPVEGSGEPITQPTTPEGTPKPGAIEEEKPLTSDDAPKENDGAGSSQPATQSQPTPLPVIDSDTSKASEGACPAEHEDLKICDSYFAEYLGKVNEWSEKHSMKMSEHMWKACTLLSHVQHVTTMCCQIFRNTCAAHLNL